MVALSFHFYNSSAKTKLRLGYPGWATINNQQGTIRRRSLFQLIPASGLKSPGRTGVWMAERRVSAERRRDPGFRRGDRNI